MTWFPRLNFAVLFVAMVVWVFPQAANAQLRSFHGIRHLMLAPPEPGAERLHRELTILLRSKGLLVEAKETLPIDCPGFEPLTPGCRPTYSWSGPGPRSQFADCALRMGLPKPRSLGFECSDFGGQYVGTIRFTSEDELFKWVQAKVPGSLVARPLTGVTHIRVRRLIDDRQRIREYVENLLRRDGTFTVVDTDEDPPASLGEHLVSCEINPGSELTYRKGSFRKPFRTSLGLLDPFGHTVRGFSVQSESVFRPSGKKLEALMRELVRQLIQARVEDAEIYRVPPESADAGVLGIKTVGKLGTGDAIVHVHMLIADLPTLLLGVARSRPGGSLTSDRRRHRLGRCSFVRRWQRSSVLRSHNWFLNPPVVHVLRDDRTEGRGILRQTRAGEHLGLQKAAIDEHQKLERPPLKNLALSNFRHATPGFVNRCSTVIGAVAVCRRPVNGVMSLMGSSFSVDVSGEFTSSSTDAILIQSGPRSGFPSADWQYGHGNAGALRDCSGRSAESPAPLAASHLLGTKSVIRLVAHDSCDLPLPVCLLQQVNDAGPV